MYVDLFDFADDQILFKSELLKSRLLDLEREIEVFRTETAALKVQRQKIEEERKELQRAIKEHKDLAQAEKVRVDNYLIEEKKRLAREKAALDNRLKDAREKAQRSKQDRDEITSLRQHLDLLKEELYQKESKWQAAQARHKSQVLTIDFRFQNPYFTNRMRIYFFDIFSGSSTDDTEQGTKRRSGSFGKTEIRKTEGKKTDLSSERKNSCDSRDQSDVTNW